MFKGALVETFYSRWGAGGGCTRARRYWPPQQGWRAIPGTRGQFLKGNTLSYSVTFPRSQPAGPQDTPPSNRSLLISPLPLKGTGIGGYASQ